MPEETNNSAPTWANFNPPVKTTPYSNGGSMNVDGTAVAPAPTDPAPSAAPPSSDPAPTVPATDPVTTVSPESLAPTPAPDPNPAVVAPSIDPSTELPPAPAPDPNPMPTSVVPEAPAPTTPLDPTPAAMPAVAPVNDPVVPAIDPPPTAAVDPVPTVAPSYPTDPAPLNPEPPAVTNPTPAPPADAAANTWTSLTPTIPVADPTPPYNPTSSVPAPAAVGSDPNVLTPAPVVPESVMPTAAAAAVPPTTAPSPPTKRGSKVPWVVGGVAVAAVVIAAGAYLYLTKFATQPSSALGAQTVADNQAILNASVGPETWENDYSTSLLAVERGGLELIVTDPPTPVTGVATAAAAPVASIRNDIASLKVKIGKAEVHLATQTTVAQSGNLQATQSASRTIDRWETLRLNDANTVDLMDLRARGGAPSSLGVTYLAAGHYTELRLYLTQATAIFTDGSTKTFDLNTNNGIVKIAKPFDVTTTGTSSFLVDFDAPHSVSGTGQAATFSPVLARLLYNGNPL